jgi:hypothetical protein
MLQEPDEIALKRKRCSELWQAYQQAFKVDNHNNTLVENIDVLSKFPSLMTIFCPCRIWKSCQWKPRKHLKEDTVYMKQLLRLYLKFMDDQHHRCIQQVVPKNIIELLLSTISQKGLLILVNFNLHLMLMQIPMEMVHKLIVKQACWLVQTL